MRGWRRGPSRRGLVRWPAGICREAEVIAADQRVDALARWLKEHGASGTLEQLRARVFTALLAGRGPETLLPEPAAP